MVYLRVKKIKSEEYLYLVRSIWDSKKNSSKQEIIKYLGRSSDVEKEDIPIDYRNDSKILLSLSKHNPKNIKKREEVLKNSKQQLFKKLISGEHRATLKIFQDYNKIFNISDFFDKVLKPVMYKIGDDWETGRVSVASQHIASNVAHSLVKFIMNDSRVACKKNKILICVPLGEEHHLGCDIIETYLASKGFQVYNMGTSVPTESILNFIEFNKPGVILLSITLEDNLKAGQRLVKKIKEQYDIPIFIGGLALQKGKIPNIDAQIIADSKLEDIPKILNTSKGEI
ncbi:MAG: B12-binding domain-containing protein [Nitrosopumilaceae archaeon]